MKISRFAFLRLSLGDLGATYDDHLILRLIWKRVVDFLLALIELFSLGVTAEKLRATIRSKSAIFLQWGPVDPKFQVEGVVPHQPFFFSENYDKCSFVWYIDLDRSFYRFVTIHACDVQTDRRTEFSSLDRVCTACSAVKSGWRYTDTFCSGNVRIKFLVIYRLRWYCQGITLSESVKVRHSPLASENLTIG